jgi:hypothetical protein
VGPYIDLAVAGVLEALLHSCTWPDSEILFNDCPLPIRNVSTFCMFVQELVTC